jgi:GTPase SAR1 family protein
MGSFISKLYEKLFSKKLEICLLGLESCGKTTFVDMLMDKPKKAIPTIGLNVKSVKKGSNIASIRSYNEDMGYRWAIPV